MMKIKYFLQLIILFLFLLFDMGNARAELNTDIAKQWALQKGEQIIRILAEENDNAKYVALDRILKEDIDLDYAAEFVVGKYWRIMNKEQQQQYKDLFNRYLAALYKEYPLSLPEGSIRFTVDKALQDKKKVSVWGTIFVDTIQVQTKNEEKGFKVLFELVQDESQIKVRDLKVEKSSLLLSFRARFYKMIHEDNDDEIAWFLEDLQTIVEDMEEKHRL